METNNRIKYHSYRAACYRMNLAMKKGFYLEAIAIQESVISDRLLSFAIRSNKLVVCHERLYTISFSKLIKCLSSCALSSSSSFVSLFWIFFSDTFI